MTSRIPPTVAIKILQDCGVDRALDFHALDSATVDKLAESARENGYRAPRNANGSTARYWHAYLCRTAAKGSTS